MPQSTQAPSPKMSSRPTRSAKLAAAQKIAKILMEEDSDNEDIYITPIVADKSSAEDLTVTSAHMSTYLPATTVEKPKTPSFSELLVSDPYPEFNAKKYIESNTKHMIVNKIKTYLSNIEENTSTKYYLIPELMKYLIANPSIMMFHPKFADVVETKMNEFDNTMNTNKCIGTYEITDKYRSEFKALSLILKSMTKFYKNLSFDGEFNTNIEKIASSLSKSADNYKI